MRSFRILLVDDNLDHRFLILRALRTGGELELVVDVAEDGEEALQHLRQQGAAGGGGLPHMVMLDLRMPRKGGLEVLEEMRADERLRAVPVCVLTSSDRPEDIRAAFENGTNAYVVKAGDPDHLRDEVAALREFWTTTSRVPEPRP